MTQDIDIAAETSICVALRAAGSDVPAILEGLEMGFLPVPHLDPRKPSTSYKVRGKGLRVDLLTPLRGRGRRKTQVKSGLTHGRLGQQSALRGCERTWPELNGTRRLARLGRSWQIQGNF